jgi:hypothetical protein
VRGATILAWERHGITRVTSSRDDGRTWTPVAVAFDAAEHPAVRARRLRAPARLLPLGERVLLYGGAERADQDYLLLVSDDLGASFRTP